VYVTAHDPLESVQPPALKLPKPSGACENVTFPVGVMGVPRPVSDTVAVQMVAVLAGVGDGMHETWVAVVRITGAVAVKVKAGELLPEWSESPP
jgi:hypothetical protein